MTGEPTSPEAGRHLLGGSTPSPLLRTKSAKSPSLPTGISTSSEPLEQSKSPYAVRRSAFLFDGEGSFHAKQFDVDSKDEAGQFSWYHLEIPRGCPSLSAGAMAVIEHLYPSLTLQEITALVSNGPYCGSLQGSLVFRINCTGPLESSFTLRMAVRLTENSIVSVALGRVPRLEFVRSIGQTFLAEIPHRLGELREITEPGSGDAVLADVRDGALVVNEELLEELLRRNHPQDADNPIPRSVAKLLVHILDTFVDQVQDIVVDVEMQVDETERILDSGGAAKGRLLKQRALPKMHLDLQRLLQSIAHSEVVFPKVKDKIAGKKWCSAEDTAAVDNFMASMRRCKENVGFLASRITALQAGLDQWQSEQINKKLYYLSFLSMVFLPLSIVTGFFGMNVGGVPWMPQTTDNPQELAGFRNVMLICLAIVLLMLSVFLAAPLYNLLQVHLVDSSILKKLLQNRKLRRYLKLDALLGPDEAD